LEVVEKALAGRMVSSAHTESGSLDAGERRGRVGGAAGL
jgi:hypothetical protein